MTYSKPELFNLGNAARLIQGSKLKIGDSGSLTVNGPTADADLDD
jgi:hypothetical protein